MIKRTPVGEDSFEIEGDGRYGLHYGPKDAARMARHMAPYVLALSRRTLRERIADALRSAARLIEGKR